jgi:hypothetical protein
MTGRIGTDRHQAGALVAWPDLAFIAGQDAFELTIRLFCRRSRRPFVRRDNHIEFSPRYVNPDPVTLPEPCQRPANSGFRGYVADG